MLTVATVPGIGDVTWCLVKLQALMRHEGATKVRLVVADNQPRRSQEFLSHFPFVASVKYRSIPFDRGVLASGQYEYLPTGRKPKFTQADWWLCPNEVLERGERLESWLPQFTPNWEIARQFQFSGDDAAYAAMLREQLGPFVVFYMGPERGNTEEGHNRGRVWRCGDWVALGRIAHEMGLRVVVVGAHWDKSWSDGMMTQAHWNGQHHWRDFTGQWPIGRTFAVIRHAQFVASYQSGIGIFATYLGIPTAMWWRPYGDSIHPSKFISFRDGMRNAWVPPAMLESGKYLGLLYGQCSADTVGDWAKGLA